jgi:hypothetical protein
LKVGGVDGFVEVAASDERARLEAMLALTDALRLKPAQARGARRRPSFEEAMMAGIQEKQAREHT